MEDTEATTNTTEVTPETVESQTPNTSTENATTTTTTVTNSSSTSSSSTAHPVQQHVSQFFQDVSELIEGEMQVGFNELNLLEQMNQVVSKKYENMNKRATSVTEHLLRMKQQYDQFKPYFEQIDQIDEAVNELAGVAKYLDQYTRNLELQLKPYL